MYSTAQSCSTACGGKHNTARFLRKEDTSNSLTTTHYKQRYKQVGPQLPSVGLAGQGSQHATARHRITGTTGMHACMQPHADSLSKPFGCGRMAGTGWPRAASCYASSCRVLDEM